MKIIAKMIVILILLGVMIVTGLLFEIPPLVIAIVWLIASIVILLTGDSYEKDSEVGPSPIALLANSIIQQAIANHATFVKVVPRLDTVIVSQCIDDNEATELMTIPKSLQEELIQRLKVMAEMDLLNRRTPQSGCIHVSALGINYLLWGETFFVYVESREEGFSFYIKEKVA